jgi:uncharacterized RDD family membrane protein YckC
VALVVDYLLVGVVAGIVAGLLGYGRTVRTAESFSTTVSGTPLTVAVILLGLVYFVAFWTGGRRATPGQRLFGIQVGNAFDGRSLTLEQALSRWIALGSWVGIFSLAAPLAALAGLVQIVWALALLATTVSSPTKQGLHDRFANTAVVRPAGSTTSGFAMACLVVVLILVGLAVLGIIFVAMSAGGIEQILSQVGTSV